MDLWQLYVFSKVVEHRSFSKAGASVHLSQPTVSSHIKYLEELFQCRLVDRLPREVRPTRAGELLYRYTQRLLTLKAEMENAMAEFLGCITGALVLGGSTIPGAYVLPAIVGSFKQSHPDVELRLQIGDTAAILQGVVDGELELGVVGARAADPRLIQEKIMEDDLRLVVPAGHAWAARREVDLTELSGLPMIVREAGSGTLRTVQQALENRGLDWSTFDIVAEMGSTEAIRQAVRAGLGVSILSVLAIADDLKHGALSALTITGLELGRSFYLTHHRDRTLSPLCRAFIAHVKSNCPPKPPPELPDLR